MLQRSSLLFALLILLALPMTAGAADAPRDATAILDLDGLLQLELQILNLEPLMSTENGAVDLSWLQPQMLGVPGCRTQQCPVDFYCLAECEAQYCGPYPPCGGPAFCSCASTCVIC